MLYFKSLKLALPVFLSYSKNGLQYTRETSEFTNVKKM